MANILALVPMNAANFDSGNAEDGEVLTADGAGGAAFESAAARLTAGDMMLVTHPDPQNEINGYYVRDGDLNGYPRYRMRSWLEMARVVAGIDALQWQIRAPGMMPGTYNVLASAYDDVATPDAAGRWYDANMEKVSVWGREAVDYGLYLVADGDGGVAYQAMEEVEGVPPIAGNADQDKVLAVVGTYTGMPPWGSWSFAAEWKRINDLMSSARLFAPTALNQVGNGSTPVTAAMLDNEYSNSYLDSQGTPSNQEMFFFIDGYTGKRMMAVRRYTGEWDAMELATLYE
jgi:hypothetical protein